MQRQYETIIIITPLLTDEQMKEVAGKYKNFLNENGAKIVHEENWGLRKLAYPIEKKSTGFYHLFEYQSEGELISKLETEFKRDEKIMRFLTVSLDKYAVSYNAKRHKGEVGKNYEKETKKQEL